MIGNKSVFDMAPQKRIQIRRWTDPSRPFRVASHTARKGGVEFQKQVTHVFERHGYYVVRSESGPDLWVWKNRTKIIVECKMSTTHHHIYISHHQVEFINGEAQRSGGVLALICFGFPDMTPRVIKTQDLLLMPSGKTYKLTPQDGIPLEKWLKKAKFK